MAIVETKLTYTDYLTTPEDERYELLNGELIMAPAPLTDHQYVLGNLYLAVRLFVDAGDLGVVYISPTDVMLSDVDVVQPDLLFVSHARAHIITRENIQGAPDLVVEVLSSSTATRDETVKRTLYARCGVKEYWLVDPDTRTVRVLLLDRHHFEEVGIYRSGQTVHSPILEGLAFDVADLFK